MRICSSGLKNEPCEPFSESTPTISNEMPRIRISWPISAPRFELSIGGIAAPMTATRRRGYPEDAARHGEQRAELVRPQRFEGHRNDLAEQHGYRGVLLESTSTVSWSVRPLVTSM